MIIRISDNNIYLHGIIWDGDEEYFSYYFDQISGVYDDINVHLHTKGGNVFAGNYIDNALASSKAKINTINEGLSSSMGAMLLTSGDYIKCVDNGYIMLHAPSGETRGGEEDHLSAANLLGEMKKNFIKRLKARTGKSDKYILENYLTGDNWFSAEQALKEGLIDEIISAKNDVKIEDASAIGEKGVFGQFAAAFDDTIIPVAEFQNKSNSKSIQMKKAIIEAFALEGVNEQSSDTAIIEALKQKNQSAVSAVQAQLDKSEESKKALETTVKEQKEAEINALLAPLKGKLEPSKIEAFQTIGETSGVATLKAVLDGVGSPTSKFENVGKSDKGSTTTAELKEGWDWDRYQKEDPRALESLPEDKFDALYEAKFGKKFER